MPVIHHPTLGRQAEVTESQAQILTTNPRVPWVRGRLPKPTAIPATSPEGDTPDPLIEED